MTDSPLILVVDDSPLQRKIYAASLKAAGYTPLVAENGIQGVEIALQNAPVLILMDVSMPEMDGPTALAELRRYPDMDHVPVIALTAVNDSDDLENLRRAGFDDVIDKNTGRDTLLLKVRQWIPG
jgi:CheY-like chemotaxis protein